MPLAAKGTIFSFDVGGSLTAVAEVLSLSLSGSGSKTFETTLLNQSGSGETHLASGYSTAPTIDVELFWVPTNAGHQAITDEITTPTVVAANQLDAQITYPDTGVTLLPFKVAGIEIGQTFEKGDGVKATVKIQTSGNPTYPT